MLLHNKSKEEVLEALAVSPTAGLTAEEAALRREKYGENKLKEKKKKTTMQRFLDQFKGKKTADYKVSKDGGKIDYITGATVTSRAITALAAEVQKTLLTNQAAIRKGLENGGK